MMNNTDDIVTVRMPKDIALTLFEWAYSFMQHPHRLEFTHPADPIGVDHLASELESELKEVFLESYPQLLASAREAVVSRYRTRMGEQNSAWLKGFRYRDSESIVDAKDGERG
jgi:hypothetical protein